MSFKSENIVNLKLKNIMTILKINLIAAVNCWIEDALMEFSSSVGLAGIDTLVRRHTSRLPLQKRNSNEDRRRTLKILSTSFKKMKMDVRSLALMS